MAVLTERTEASVDGIASPADVNLPLGFALLAVDVVAIGTVAKDELIEILHVALATHEKVTCVARRAPGVGNAVRAEHLSAVLADFHLRSGRVTVAATAPFLVSVAKPEVKAGSVFGEVQKLNIFVNPLQHKAVALHRFVENFLLVDRETLLESVYAALHSILAALDAALGEAQKPKTLLFRTSLHADETHELSNIGNV